MSLDQETYKYQGGGFAVPGSQTAYWIRHIVLVFVVVGPILIVLLAPGNRWAVAFMAYLNCLIYSVFAVYFLKKGTLGYLIPVIVPLWTIIGNCVGVIYFAMFLPNASYSTASGHVSFFAGGVKYQLAILSFFIVYFCSMARLLRKEDNVEQYPGTVSKSIAYLTTAIVVFSVSVEIFAWFARTAFRLPLSFFLWAGRLYARFQTLLFVAGVAVVRMSKAVKMWLVIFLVAMVFFYTLRNARGMALMPIAALVCGFLFFSESKARTKLALTVAVAIGVPLYLMIGNTARILLGTAVGREASFGQQLAAVKDWRTAAEQSDVGVSFFGRMFFTAGNVIVAHTPSMHPYRYPSPVKYAKELAIYMLPDQLIRRLTGITDPITKLSVLLETDYTGTWLLRDWGMDVTPTSAVGVSTIGHFWMLGGFLPVLFGGFAVALVHTLVARITRRFWVKNPDKAIYYFAALLYCFIWSMSWDFIQLLRNVLWNSIYALAAWMVISQLLKISGITTSEQYEQPELTE